MTSLEHVRAEDSPAGQSHHFQHGSHSKSNGAKVTASQSQLPRGRVVVTKLPLHSLSSRHGEVVLIGGVEDMERSSTARSTH